MDRQRLTPRKRISDFPGIEPAFSPVVPASSLPSTDGVPYPLPRVSSDRPRLNPTSRRCPVRGACGRGVDRGSRRRPTGAVGPSRPAAGSSRSARDAVTATEAVRGRPRVVALGRHGRTGEVRSGGPRSPCAPRSCTPSRRCDDGRQTALGDEAGLDSERIGGCPAARHPVGVVRAAARTASLVGQGGVTIA